MQIHHTQFGRFCSEIKGTECYWTGRNSQESLGPGQILRVYTGSRQYEASLSAEDRGADINWRGFAERGNFVLNNACGDTVSVYWLRELSQQTGDSAAYYANPPEGVLLRRVGDRLVP
jgi:hypothetical protein